MPASAEQRCVDDEDRRDRRIGASQRHRRTFFFFLVLTLEKLISDFLGTSKADASKLSVPWPLCGLAKLKKRKRRVAPRTGRLREDTEKGELVWLSTWCAHPNLRKVSRTDCASRSACHSAP
jgi:hypothetical protein